MRHQRCVLAAILVYGAIVGTSFSADTKAVFTESFEKAPNAFITLVDGVRGKAGRFDGKAYTHLRVNRKTGRFKIELHFHADDVETSGVNVPDWRPLSNPEGGWNDGDFQLILREGKGSAHIHNGGLERVKLYTPPLKNKTWYKLGLVMDAAAHTATLYLDDRQVDTAKLNESIHFFTIRSPAFASGNKVRYRGLLDEIRLELDPFEEIVTNDPRNINRGIALPHHELYADQPLIVVTPKGSWVCCLTVAPGGEGSRGQHVVAIRSTDGGKTWGDVVDIESAKDGGGYVTPLATPYGRIYAFYNPPHDPNKPQMPGVRNYFCYKYSDDEGLTWSKRYWLPIRDSAWDLQREAIQAKKGVWCWCIAKPVIDGSDVFFPFAITDGVDGNGAGWIAHSDNILTEKDADKIHWEILPEGDKGIRNPAFGSTQEEHCLLPMNQKDAFVCIYRTRQGFPAVSYSTDRCKTWSLPEKMAYANGRTIMHPRACPMIWKCKNGKYLFWGHNNSHPSFANRNPVWVCGGIERDGKIHWSQPEILLYADDPALRMSYPDLVEFKGEYWISETEKELPRIHKIDNQFLEGIWQRLENDLAGKPTPTTQRGLVLETSARTAAFPKSAAKIPETQGFTLDFTVDVPTDLKPGTLLIDNRDQNGNGIAVIVGKQGTFLFEMAGMNAGKRQAVAWDSDENVLSPGKHRVTVIVDQAPRIVSFVVDGQINDGHARRERGWTHYWLAPDDISGTGTLRMAPSVRHTRIYNRYLHLYEL